MLLRLQLISTGEFFVMDPSGSLTIEINSSVFNNQDDFLGSLSYEGTVPLEDNMKLIRNAHLITTPADLRTLGVMAWLGNLPWKQVQFIFTIEGRVIHYNLIIDKGIIAKDMSTRLLTQVFTDGNLGSYTADLFRQFMLDTVMAEPGTIPVVFFPVKNDAPYQDVPESSWGDYGGINFPISNYINNWQIIDGVGSFVVDPSSASQRETQIPFFNLVYVIKKVLKFYGLTPVGTWLKDPHALRIHIWSQVPILAYILSDFNDHMPAITVIDFLKEVRNVFGLLIDVDQTRKIGIVESLKYLEDTPDVIDLRNAQLDDFRELPITNDGYTISQDVDSNDQAFNDDDKNNLPKLVIGDGTTEIQLNSVMTKMIVETSPASVSTSSWRLPYIKGPIYPIAPYTQIPTMEYKDRNNFKLRLLYFHGLQPDAAGFNYPYGSSDNLNFDNVPISDFTLSLVPAGSAFQSIKHKYEFIKNSKPFEMGFSLSKESFLRLAVKSRIIIRDFNQATVNCILSSYSADIDYNQNIKAKLTLYPVIRPNNKVQIIPADPDTPGPPVDNGTVYVKLQYRDYERQDFTLPPPPYSIVQFNMWAMFYEDAAGTIPKTVTSLPVRYSQTINYATGNPITSNATIECTGTEFELYHHAPSSSTSGGFTSWDYKLMTSNYYHILT